jgi:hypothetical protein
VGCGGGDTPDRTTTLPDEPTTSTTAGPTTSTTAPGGEATPQACTNDEDGYTVEYPSGWSTNAGEVVPPCRFFHPEPFGVPEATEVIGLAVTVSVEPVPFERVSGSDDLTEEELSREETTVAGRPAVRVETVSTGDGLLPEGIRSYRYAVDLDGRTLVAVTRDVEGLDYAGNQDVVDAMMASLELVPES